jgi:dienelactone hydrolase
MAIATAQQTHRGASNGRTSVSAEFRVFAAATTVGLLHAVDDAVLNRQPGVPVGQHLPALLVTLLVAAAGLLAFRRVRPGLRAALALTFGVLAAVNGGLHAIHVVNGSVSGSDVTGLFAAGAGVVLVALAGYLPFRHRGESGHGRLRTWANRGIATVATVLFVVFVLLAFSVAIVQTHKYRAEIGSPPSDAYRAVGFESTDGLRLSGWYTPSRNRAAVIVVSSARGDRNGSLEHAELLASHGYGVLLYDARGTGESEGSPNGYGWEWEHDVAGAIEFLQEQPEVDPTRIGGLGLSTGADVLIEVAASNDDLRAVVGDGATGRSIADMPPDPGVAGLSLAPVFLGVRLLSGTSPGAPLEELAAQVAPTPLLLVAAGSLPQEIEMNAVYAAAAQEPVELWELPQVRHTAAIREVAEEYERRVVAHFDRALVQVAN